MLENANLHWKKSILGLFDVWGLRKKFKSIKNDLKWTCENKVQKNALKVNMYHLVKVS